MQLDFSRDYLTWDNVESVHVESVRNGKGLQCRIDRCLRSELTAKEKAASGGVYVGAEMTWLLPVAEMPANFVPKPADVLTDFQLDNLPWTIQDVAGQCRDATGYQVYKVRGLALSIAYQLRDVIDIERAETTYDAAGAQVKTWPADGVGKRLYPNLAARVQEQSGEVAEERGIQGFKGNYTIYVSKPVPLVTFEDRVKWVKGGVTYYLNILGVHQPDRIDELPALDAVLAP